MVRPARIDPNGMVETGMRVQMNHKKKRERACIDEFIEEPIIRFSRERFLDGLSVGLASLDRVVSWLSSPPNTREQSEVRTWVQNEILAIRAKYDVEA